MGSGSEIFVAPHGDPAAGDPAAQSKAPQRNLTDPDSRILPTRRGWVQGYNAQLAVSADWLILALMLTTSTSDIDALVPMMQRVENATDTINTEREVSEPLGPEPLGPEPLGVVLADAGYCSVENLTAPGPDRVDRACHANGVSRGWTKIDRCDRHGGREGHLREQQPARSWG